MSNTKTKLNQSDVIDIRRYAAVGYTPSTLSGMYQIDDSYVSKIIKGKRWTNVPADRTVKGFENYEVTADGRVWSHAKSGYLTPTKNGKVTLTKVTKNGTRKYETVEVSTLVQKHFS